MERATLRHGVLENLCFTVIAVIALILGGWNRAFVVIGACGYFTISTLVITFTSTGGLRDVILHWIEHKTRRFEIEARLEVITMKTRVDWLDAERAGLPASLPAREYELVASAGSNFVSAQPSRLPGTSTQGGEQATRQQARAWLASLFDQRSGEVRGDRVVTESASEGAGRLWVPVPLGEVRRILFESGAVLVVQNGYALNMRRIKRLEDIDQVV